MSAEAKRDNTTFDRKKLLRRRMLAHMAERGEDPVVLETHGGYGKLWVFCYAEVKQGVVFEKKPEKAEYLSRQRPAWAVYENDCVRGLEAGAGSHLPVNVLDLNPYGDPWPAIAAFLETSRPRPPRLYVVVNDGLRRGISIGAWKLASMAEVVASYGNKLRDVYLEVCEDLLERKALEAGYTLEHFIGYYCGAGDNTTHYLGVLERIEEEPIPSK